MEIERIVRKQERRTITGVADTQWDEMEDRGEAPRRRQIGRRIVGWKLSELVQWVNERPPVPIGGNRPADEGAANSQAAA